MFSKWIVKKTGNLDSLKLLNDSKLNCSESENEIEVHYCGLNFADVFACLGLYSATPDGPFTPGLEFSGIIRKPARNSAYKTGDKVSGLIRFGGYSEMVSLPDDYLIPLQKNWSLADSAAFPVQALTAWYGLKDLGRIQDGETVLIHSAAGGVGIHALQIAKSKNAEIIATIGSQNKAAFLNENYGLKNENIIIRNPARFASQLDDALNQAGKEGIDIVFDAVGDPYFKPAWERLLPAGRFIYFGSAGFMPTGKRPGLKQLIHYLNRTKIDPLDMISSNKTLSGFNLIWLYHRAGELSRLLNDMKDFPWNRPHIGKVFKFEDAPNALEFFRSGKSTGKVILKTRFAAE